MTSAEQKEYRVLLEEIEKTHNEWRGKKMPQNIDEQLVQKCERAEELQKQIDVEKADEKRDQRIERLKAFSKEIPEPVLPPVKDSNGVNPGNRIAGYVTVGQLFASSPELAAHVANGSPEGAISAAMKTLNLLPIRGFTPKANGLIALSPEEVKAFRSRMESKAREQKAFPVLGTDVIEPLRIDRFVQDTMPDVLTIRDVLNVSPTSSPVIDFIKEVSYTRAAAIVSEGVAKPEASVVYTKERVDVVVIAVWIPVTEQMLQDAPALINRIDTRLLWDLKQEEEQQIGYGDGSGENFTGLFDSGTGIDAMRTSGGDTLIDIIRRGITDVRTSGYNPNAVWIHPEDWEAIELAKGSDGHYIWAVIRDQLGARLWSLRVVEGTGTRLEGDTTTHVAVGDFRMGATLYDRQQSNIRIGWQDKQFIENTRTILAEERVGFAVEAPKAFRIHQTAA